MTFTPRTIEQIADSIRNKIAENFPELDTSEGTIARISLIDPFSLEISQIEELLSAVKDSFYILTANGLDLDLKAFDYNVQRRGAQKSSGFVQVFLPRANLTDPITIPTGTVIRSLSNVTYTTVSEYIINGFNEQQKTRNGALIYEVSIPVVSSSTGSTGNATSNQLTTIAISGLSCTNDSAIIGGFEEEPDESLAARIILSFGIWSRGVKSAVEFGARTVSGVFYANGISDYPGHFNIFVSDVSGVLTDEMRDAVDTVLIDWAAEGIAWDVLPPPLFLVNTTAKVTFIDPSNQATKVSQFQTDMSSVINSNTTSSLFINELYANLTEKVKSYVKAFDIDSPVDHVIKDNGTIIRSGTIGVTVV